MISIEGKDTTNRSVSSPYYSSAEIEESFRGLLTTKIRQGYPEAVGESGLLYQQNFLPLLVTISKELVPRGAMLSLVDPRIPFLQQVRLQDAKVDDAVYYRPRHEVIAAPYATWLDVVDRDNPIKRFGRTTLGMLRLLSNNLRPASPMEAVGAGIVTILGRGFVTMPGGEVEIRPQLFGNPEASVRTLSLDRYFGAPRVTHLLRDEDDGLVGMLVAYNNLAQSTSTNKVA